MIGITPNQWLTDKLASLDELVAAVGSRIYPARLPQRSDGGEYLPAVTYRRKSTERPQDTLGSPAIATAVFEVRVWSEDYTQAAELAEFVVAPGLESRLGVEDGLAIHRTSINALYDDEEAPYLADDVAIHAAVIELEIVYQAAASAAPQAAP